MAGADDQTLFIMHELSKNSQATDFACRAAIEHNAYLRALNGKTYRNEKGLGETRADVDNLKDQAKVVTPFLKPISMFATLWTYPLFKWFFIGGCIFFLFVLYPYLLKIGLLDLLDSYFRGR